MKAQNLNVWISSKRAIELLEIKKQTFHAYRKQNKFDWQYAKCSDGSKFLIHLSSLPVKAQQKYLEVNGVILPNNKALIPKKESNNLMRDDYNDLAFAKDTFLRKYLEFAEAKKQIVKAKKQFINIFNAGLVLPELHKKIGNVNYSTVETHWKKPWLEAGKDPRVLVPKYPNRSKSTITEEEAKVLIKYALTPNNRPIRQCARDARDHFIIQNFPNIKHLNTYIRWIHDFRKRNFDVWTLIREGEKALEEKVLKSIFRDYDKIEVGDIIVADGHKLNFEILNPFTNKYKRFNLLMFYDMKSNMPLGWDISLTEDTASITAALYRSILRLGKLPKVIYLDNGKAFRSNYLNGTDLEQSGIVGVFQRLDIRVMFAKPYNAKAKTIERFFKTFAELEMKMPTYCGTSIQTQPARMKRNEKLHRRFYNTVMENTTIDIWTAHKLIASFIDEYAQREQQSGHLKGVTPFELFSKGMGPGIDKKELLMLMMAEKEVTITANGVRLFGRYYYDRALYGLKGSVTVRYDITDLDVVYIFDEHNNYLCPATYDPKVHPAAGILGNTDDIYELERQHKLKSELKHETKAKATYLLSTNMVDTIHKNIERAQKHAKLLEEGSSNNKIEKQKKASIFRTINADIEIVEEKSSNLLYKKVAEG